MASIEFSKKYADGRVVTVEYRTDREYDYLGVGLAKTKQQELNKEKRHQDTKYYEAIHASETKALEAYKELCTTLEWD